MTNQSLATLIFAAPFLALVSIFALVETARIVSAIRESKS